MAEKINIKDIQINALRDGYIKTDSTREDNLPTVKILSNIEFNDVEFIDISFSPVNINKIDNIDYNIIRFENCKFNNFTIMNYKYEIHFKNCTFESIEISYRFDNLIFDDCNIEKFTISKYLSLKDSKMSAGNNVVVFYGGHIAQMLLVDLINFEHRLYINPQSKKNSKQIYVKTLRLEACNFMENFKLHNAIVDEIELTDVNFEANADFFKTTFKKGIVFDLITGDKIAQDDISFSSLNFRGMALFGSTVFEQKLMMQYVTFEKTTHFKNATFKQGIDLENTNSKDGINFLNLSGLKSLNTSQETFRIIKHNFKKIDNTIAANKFHSLELTRHRKNIKILHNSSWIPLQDSLDWIVSALHFITSNYSRNWLLTLIWIFLVSLGTNFYFEHPINLECIFKYINILTSIDDFDHSYIAMTLNKIALGYLYYQFLLSIRINTKVA